MSLPRLPLIPLQVCLLIPIYDIHPSLTCPIPLQVCFLIPMYDLHPSLTCPIPLQVCLIIPIYDLHSPLACLIPPSGLSPHPYIWCTSLLRLPLIPLQVCLHIPIYDLHPSLVCPIPFRSVSSSLYMAYIPPLSAPSPNQACLLIPIYGLHPLLACPIPPSGLSPHPPAPARSQGLRVGALSSPVCTHTAINICLDAVVILLLSFLLLH